MNKYLTAILLFVFVSLLCGQNVKVVDRDNNNLRLQYVQAIRLENEGQVEKALNIYRDLVREMPTEKLFYVKYFDLMFKQKKHDELSKVLPEFIEKYPDNDKAKIDLGKFYFIQQDTLKAKQTWKKFLEEKNYAKLFTRHLFYTMASLQLREEAENILLTARKRNRDENLFCKELADLYHANGQHEEATGEYLKYLAKDDRNFNYVSDMLARFPDEEKVINRVDSVLIAAINKTDQQIFHNLRADYLFNSKRYEGAASEILAIEKKNNYSGATVLEFADNLIKMKAYEFAKRFFSEIIDNKNFSSITPQILLKLAKIEEHIVLAATENTYLNYFLPENYFVSSQFIFMNEETGENLSRAFSIYDSVSSLKNIGNISNQAEFNIGKLRYAYLRDFDGAIKHFDRAEEKSKSIRFRHEVFNYKFLAILAKNDLKTAEKILTKRKTRYGRNFEKDYLRNKLLLDFLSQDFESFIKAKNEVIKKLGIEHNLFNDYLELLTITENNYKDKDDEAQKDFARFVKSELLLRQGKLSESAEILKFVTNNRSPISDEALYRLAQVYLQTGFQNEAEKVAAKLLETDSKYRDSVIRLIGEYYYDQSNFTKAKEWYQNLLLDYPNSFHIEIARQRLRQIRGDDL